jgi:hypothetical protein
MGAVTESLTEDAVAELALSCCSNCDRRFKRDRIAKHEAACIKASQKRQVFVVETVSEEAAKAKMRAINTTDAPGDSQTEPRRKMQTHRERLVEILTKANPEKLSDVDKILEAFAGREHKLFANLEKKYGLTTGGKKPKWQREHRAFQAMLRQAKRDNELTASGVELKDLPPPVDDEPIEDDRTECPHCNRKFNQQAAERHIPQCANIRAQPKLLRRGGGLAAHNGRSQINSQSSRGALLPAHKLEPTRKPRAGRRRSEQPGSRVAEVTAAV